MPTYAIIAVLCLVAGMVLRRPIVALLRWALLVVGVLLAGRLALLADARPAALGGAVIGGVVGFVVVGILAYAIIYHALIAADEQRDVDRARETAKRRRLW